VCSATLVRRFQADFVAGGFDDVLGLIVRNVVLALHAVCQAMSRNEFASSV
jgi:hypothetical protein